MRNQRSCPDSRPSRRLWVSQGEDPPLSTPIDGAGNGPPVSGRPRQPGLPESGLAGTTGPAVAFGREGSHWRHGVPCVQSAVQPPTPTNRWSPPARPPHRRGRLCTKSPRTRAPCRVPSQTLRRRPSPAPPCGDSGSGVAGAKFQAEPRSHMPPAAGLCSACPVLCWQCLYCPPNLLDTFEKQEFSHKSSDVLGL